LNARTLEFLFGDLAAELDAAATTADEVRVVPGDMRLAIEAGYVVVFLGEAAAVRSK
jgi:hypothetical protein